MSNSNHTPVFLPLGVSRKKTDTCPGFKRPPKRTRPVPPSVKKEAASKQQLVELKPGCNNRLLAGCMAHEFLTKGTLLGHKYDPARAEAAPLAGGQEKKKAGMAESSKPIQVKKHESYAEVSNLLKSDGVHIPGIVKPTQLSQWLQQM